MKRLEQRLNVLVSGAGFAGLTTAYWMNRLGYRVTVVETAKGLKTGGTPVDIKDHTVDIVKRMGLLEKICSNSLKPRSMNFINADGVTAASMPAPAVDEQGASQEYEIERDTLLNILFEEVSEDVEFLFEDSIAGLDESADELVVTFRSGEQRPFSFVFGCDGNRSAVRRICFGEESAYSTFLQTYFSITITDGLLIEENTSLMFNVPGKAVLMHAYNNKTDIVFCFYSEEELSYDYRNQDEQRSIILQQFQGVGWRTPELLKQAGRSKDFYFDKLYQIKMPSWTKGRVALVGDAGYCASPAAGMGGSLAIIGATALADAFQKHPDNFEAAFLAYNDSLRPFIEEVQAHAVKFGLEMLVPRTEEAIRQRNAQLNLS